MSDERTATRIDRKLGERVRARRLEIDMSQEKLADLLGVTFQQVQKYEKGVNRIASSRMIDIASALRQPVAVFFDGLGGPDNGADTQRATPEGSQLLGLFASITSVRLRRKIVDLVRGLADDEAEARAMACSGPRAKRRNKS